MTVHQLSVFVENKSGTLLKVLELLKEAEIQLIASTISDTVEYGIYRIICSDPQRAFQTLNNAGISLHEPTFFDVRPETFDAQIATNLRGGFFLTQCFTKLLLREKRPGNVLFVSSETGETVDIRPYGFTKAAVNSMVQGLACLFVKDGIRVNAVAPGITASDMTGLKADGNLYLSCNATERVYLPEEVAETACFLLSDASGCISGQVIVCNNGRTINPRWK